MLFSRSTFAGLVVYRTSPAGVVALAITVFAALALLVAAGFGGIVDMATLEGGLFMSSAVLMALATPAINRLLAPRKGMKLPMSQLFPPWACSGSPSDACFC